MRGLTPGEVADLAFLASPHGGSRVNSPDSVEAERMYCLLAQGRVLMSREHRREGTYENFIITEQGRRALSLWHSLGGEACLK